VRTHPQRRTMVHGRSLSTVTVPPAGSTSTICRSPRSWPPLILLALRNSGSTGSLLSASMRSAVAIQARSNSGAMASPSTFSCPPMPSSSRRAIKAATARATAATRATSRQRAAVVFSSIPTAGMRIISKVAKSRLASVAVDRAARCSLYPLRRQPPPPSRCRSVRLRRPMFASPARPASRLG
jgi:hypothetical protein